MGLNQGNYMRLRPAPVWKGGPDASGQVPSGSESWRDYRERVNRWVFTGQRVGVANGLLAGEWAEALPDGPKVLIKNLTAVALLNDGRPPGTLGPQDQGEQGGLDIIFERLNRQYLDRQTGHATKTEGIFEATKRKPGDTMAKFRGEFITRYEDAVRESGNRYQLPPYNLSKRLLDGAGVSAIERMLILNGVGHD